MVRLTGFGEYLLLYYGGTGRRMSNDGDLLAASVAAAVAAYDRGATITRAHDVKAHVDALKVAAAVA